MEIKVGDIIILDDAKQRIIYLSQDLVVLCQMDVTVLNLTSVPLSLIVQKVEDNPKKLIHDVDVVVNTDTMSKKELQTYLSLCQLTRELDRYYGPTYFGLTGRATKEKVNELLTKFSLTRPRFWRICTAYLQSGFKNSSLIRKRRGQNRYNYTKKTGNPGIYGVSGGCILDEKAYEALQDALAYYKSGRTKSYRTAYDYMNSKHYSVETIENGVFTKTLLPQDKRPSLRQLNYYFQQHLSAAEREIVKTSKREFRNDSRPLFGSAADRTEFPGEKVESDIVEFDNSLCSIFDRNQTIGRPIVYILIDVLTSAIVAMSVGLENNSQLGLENLLVNLGEDKVQYCKQFGIDLEDSKLWPSQFIPLEFYTDRGSDFKSKGFAKQCQEIGIRRHLVPGGMGSLKGTIESWFHQAHTWINPHTEGHGQIQKRYDSWHHKQATLNIYEFTHMMIVSVLLYNQHIFDTRTPSVDELTNHVPQAPIGLWQYYCKKNGSPKPITDQNQYLWSLLRPRRAKVTRHGICVGKLYYINKDDSSLMKMILNAKNSKYTIDIRYDPRDNSRIFYLDNQNKLMIADMLCVHPWMRQICGYTWHDTDAYFHTVSVQQREARQQSDALRSARFEMLENSVQDAAAEHIGQNNTKDMRKKREQEKQALNRKSAISDKLDTRALPPQQPISESEQLTQPGPPQIMPENTHDTQKSSTTQKKSSKKTEESSTKRLSNDEYFDLLIDDD